MGAAVAAAAGVGFLDTDAAIVARAGRSIAEIFFSEGEPYFRRLEQQAIREALSGPARVLSLGGGGPVDARNRAMLSAIPVRVWLTATVSELRRRMLADAQAGPERPALVGMSAMDEIEMVLAHRAPIYAAFATHTLATDGATVEQVAQCVLDLWRSSLSGAAYAGA